MFPYIYAKEIDSLEFGGFKPEENILKRYNKVESETNRKYREIDLRKTGDSDRKTDRPNMFYYFYYDKNEKTLSVSKEKKHSLGLIEIIPLKDNHEDGRWRWGIETAQKNLFKLEAKFMPNRGIWGIVEKDYLDERPPVKPTSLWTFKDLNSERGSEQFIELGFEKEIFPRPKPYGTIYRTLLTAKTSNNDIILDFFAGSSTTAHAVMQLNAEDGGNRKFIMVQLPEEVEEKHEAYKAGYKTIAEISKERVRRAGKQILDGDCHENWNKDVGFRVLKVDSSNMKDVYYRPAELGQQELTDMVSPIKEDRSSEDLLFQVMLDLGLELHLPITSTTVQGKEVFFVDDNLLVACFAPDISEELVLELTEHQPLRMVFADCCFGNNDSLKTNAKQIFKQRSPDTSVMGFF